MIERYEKEMRKMFEIAPKADVPAVEPVEEAVETAVFPEDAPSVPQFQQREQSGVEIPEPTESAPPMFEQPVEPQTPMMPLPQMPRQPLTDMVPVQPQPEQPMPDKIGSIVVEVTTARGAVPLSGVTVIIDRLDVDDPGGRQELIAVETTNADGRTKPVAVQTVSRDLSLTPGNGNPFATFYISAKAEGFEPVKSRPVDVFADEMSILKIDLIPKPEKLGEGGMA
ncbi:MAG: hypothetical protein IJ306_06140 [Oscillospiraceae bacterium]|nr:hypothetical protein [Oscillospiraceae bacterium]